MKGILIMKKFLLLVLCVTAMAVSGCGKKDDKVKNENVQDPAPQVSTEGETISDLTSISAEEENGKMKLTLPKEVFGGKTEELAPQMSEARGFEDVQVNSDGSATFTMTKAQHKEWLSDYAKSIEDGITDVIAKNNLDSIENVSYSKDYTSAVVKVDVEMFEKKKNDKMVAETIANKLKMYNYFAGKKPENVKVSVKFVDASNDKELETLEY